MKAVVCSVAIAIASLAGVSASSASAAPFQSGYCSPGKDTPGVNRAIIVRYFVSMLNKRNLAEATSFLTQDVAAFDMDDRAVAVGADVLKDYDPSDARKIEIIELIAVDDTVVIKAREDGDSAEDDVLISFRFTGGCISAIAF